MMTEEIEIKKVKKESKEMKKGLRAIFGVGVGVFLSIVTFLTFIPPKGSHTVANADVDVVAEYLGKTYEEQKTYPLFFRAVGGDVTIQLTKLENVQVSGDGKQWRAVGVDETVSVDVGALSFWRTSEDKKTSFNGTKVHFVFEGAGQVESYGNTMSLWERETFETKTTCEMMYGLFRNCDKLLTAPLLPASDSVGFSAYQFMFAGCSNLEKAPLLPAKSLGDYAYFGMFQGCSKLNEIHVSFSYWGTEMNYLTMLWVDSVAPSGTFYCPGKLQKEYGADRIPQGWELGMEWEEGEIVTGYTGTYDGKDHRLELKYPTNVSSELKVSYSILDTQNGTYKEVPFYPYKTSVGVQHFKVTFEAEGYKTEEFITCFDIQKAKANLEVVSIRDWAEGEYDKAEIEVLTNFGKAEIKYYSANDTSRSKELRPEDMKAGDYVAAITVQDTEDYEGFYREFSFKVEPMRGCNSTNLLLILVMAITTIIAIVCIAAKKYKEKFVYDDEKESQKYADYKERVFLK